jgi:hypothetical protein
LPHIAQVHAERCQEPAKAHHTQQQRQHHANGMTFHVLLPAHCAFVAVTTATELGVATPSTGGGAGGAGGGAGGAGGFAPTGGAPLDCELPPHPAIRTMDATSAAGNTTRKGRVIDDTFDMRDPPG